MAGQRQKVIFRKSGEIEEGNISPKIDRLTFDDYFKHDAGGEAESRSLDALGRPYSGGSSQNGSSKKAAHTDATRFGLNRKEVTSSYSNTQSHAVNSGYVQGGLHERLLGIQESSGYIAYVPSPMSLSCSICRAVARELCCEDCIAKMHQQKNTALKALKADTEVLRKKAERLLEIQKSQALKKSALPAKLREMEALTAQVLAARDRLCLERVAIASKRFALTRRRSRIDELAQLVVSKREKRRVFKTPILHGLRQLKIAADEELSRIRRRRARELIIDIFKVKSPVLEKDAKRKIFNFSENIYGKEQTGSSSDEDKKNEEERKRELEERWQVAFKKISSIHSLPLPNSGDYSALPPQVVGSALGNVIHLLLLLGSLLEVRWLYPMAFNGSFSTIGGAEEGAGCHTLYPDGTPGFHRGLALLRRNVVYLCLCSNMQRAELKSKEVLVNISKLSRWKELGRIDKDARDKAYRWATDLQRQEKDVAADNRRGDKTMIGRRDSNTAWKHSEPIIFPDVLPRPPARPSDSISSTLHPESSPRANGSLGSKINVDGDGGTRSIVNKNLITTNAELKCSNNSNGSSKVEGETIAGHKAGDRKGGHVDKSRVVDTHTGDRAATRF